MAARFLPDDLMLDILYRVSTDITALFRCATACKRWRGLVTDRSFLLRCWPEGECHQSSLLGYFDLPEGHMEISTRRPFLFIPPLTGSVLGAQPRFVASIVHGAPVGVLDGAVALLAHGGLLLLQLARGNYFNSVHLAVCDPLAGTFNVLPPIECKVGHVCCAILTGADLCSSEGHHEQRKSSSGSSKNFKVLTIVVSKIVANRFGIENKECNLYMFSSANARWSAPRKCFDKPRFSIESRYAAVCNRVAHWFVTYYPKYDIDNDEDYVHDEDHWRKYYTYNVNAETGHHSLTQISIPAGQLYKKPYGGIETLSVDGNGSLSLFCMYKNDDIRRLDIWTRQGGVDSDVWLLVRILDLKPPIREWDPYDIHMWSGEKSGTLLIQDNHRYVHRINVETGTMEEEKFEKGLGLLAMPMEIDWPILFASRLG